MARSRWKLEYFTHSIWRKILIIKKQKKPLRKRILYDRSSTIPDCFYQLVFRISKGKRYRRLLVTDFIIGKKFGEFSFTRKPYHFPVKRSKKKKNTRR